MSGSTLKKVIIKVFVLLATFLVFVAPVFAENIKVSPIMTSGTSPEPYVVTESSYTGGDAGWRAFNDIKSSADVWQSNTSNGWLKIDFGSDVIVRNYIVTSTYTAAPKDWTFEGSNDDVNYIVLDTRSNQSSWGGSTSIVSNSYSFVNDTPYRYYRLNVSANNGYSNLWVRELELYGEFVSTPLSPSDFAGVADSSSQITWTWTDASNNETGFRIYDGLDNLVTTLSSDVNQWVESGLTENTSYTRYIKAYNDSGESGASNTATVATLGVAPNAPSGLQGSSSGSDISLSWVDNSTNELGFKIYDDLGNLIGSVSENITFFNETGLADGDYVRKVLSYNSYGESAFSESVVITVYNDSTIGDSVGESVYSTSTAFKINLPSGELTVYNSITLGDLAFITLFMSGYCIWFYRYLRGF